MEKIIIDKTKESVATTFNSTKKKTGIAKISKTSNKEKCLNKLKRLLSSKRLDLISLVNSGDRKAFRVKTNPQQNTGVLYSGLTKRLKEVFYPDGGEEHEKEYRKRREIGAPKSLFKGKKSSCGIYGKDHGILVHKQIEDYTNVLVLDGDVQSFFNMHEIPDPCFLRFIKTCDNAGWIPMVSELFIFNEHMEIATGVDCLLLDTKDFSIVVGEVKTGYESMCYTALSNDKFFSPPLDFIQDCPLNRHALQLMVTKIILSVSYRVVPEKFKVIRMCPKQGITKIYDMPDWFYDKNIAEKVYESLIRQRKT